MSDLKSETVLQIHSSGRVEGSNTRALSNILLDKLNTNGKVGRVVERDLLDGVSLLDPEWITANFTPVQDRSADQNVKLGGSNMLVEELEAADTIIIGMPVYNFGPPAALKAWIDQIARAGRTFKYEQSGPVGLLTGKRAFLIVASGGVEIHGATDFATGYMKHVLGFVGIKDVTVIEASQINADMEGARAAAEMQINSIQI